MKKKENKTNEEKPIVFYSEELKKNKAINDDTVKIISFIIILIVVLGVFALLYYLNGKYVTKDIDSTTTTQTTTEPIYDNTKVTVDTMFNLSKDTYYVLAYDGSDDIDGTYLYSLAKSYSDDKIKVYSLDLSNAMNKNYYDTKGTENTKPTKPSEVKFTKNTLVVFKKGKVVEYITNKDDIVNKLRVNKNTSK